MKNYCDEGWFKEYEGCDLGYLTFTLYFLIKYAIKNESEDVIRIIRRSIEFCSFFLHPDLGFGGFYGSRETMHFLPYSFEIVNSEDNLGIKMVNSYLSSLEIGNGEIMSDNRFSFLPFNNFLELYHRLSKDRTNETYTQKSPSRLFEESGLYVFNEHPYYTILSLKKGGILYVFKDKKLIFRSCGIVGVTNKGILVSTGFKKVNYKAIKKGFIINGNFKEYTSPIKLDAYKMIILNILKLIGGRFQLLRNFLKRFLIKMLIINESISEVKFEFKIEFLDPIHLGITISKPPKIKFKDLRISSYFPLKFIPSSGFFQKNDLFVTDYSLNKSISFLNKYNYVNIKLKI